MAAAAGRRDKPKKKRGVAFTKQRAVEQGHKGGSADHVNGRRRRPRRKKT